MYIANELKSIVELPGVDIVRDNFLDNLSDIIIKFFSDKSMFTPDDFTFHVLDEYVLNTNCNKDIFINVYLEIDQPLNYKPTTKKSKKSARGSGLTVHTPPANTIPCSPFLSFA